MPSLSSPRRLSLINLTLHRRAICVVAKETLLGDKRAGNVTDLGPTGFKLLPESFKPELRNSCVIVATTARKYLFERNTRDVPCELHQGQILLLPRFNRKQKTKKKPAIFLTRYLSSSFIPGVRMRWFCSPLQSPKRRKK